MVFVTNGPHYRHVYGGYLIEYFRLNAVYNTVTKLNREVVQTPDRTPFRRQVTIVKEWKRSTKRFGSGLEHNHEEGVSITVKIFLKGTLTTPSKVSTSTDESN